ncbi:hypothetical protein KIN20_005887 [Parelaphostrongylus tenuis]|uniref:Uncharacterized protein n=1 Tax=Parelaphostrongylus tenuis TaxID=148309 RepID=A0AAD5M115_PARTN|nr:hypothetical protein KIN20_005887 [Parelaphostrongylus tenuis]
MGPDTSSGSSGPLPVNCLWHTEMKRKLMVNVMTKWGNNELISDSGFADSKTVKNNIVGKTKKLLSAIEGGTARRANF